MKPLKDVLCKVRQDAKSLFILLVIAILLEAMLPARSMVYYEPQGEWTELDLSTSFGHIGAEISEGYHRVTGGDPQFQMNTAERGEMQSVLLTLEKPLEKAMPCQLFYHSGNNEVPYTEGTSLVRLLLPGETQLLFELTPRQYHSLRFDIQESCQIESIRVSDQTCKKIYLPAEKKQFLPLRAAVIFVVLCAAYLYFKWNKMKLLANWKAACNMLVKRAICAVVGIVTAAIGSYLLYHLLWVFGFPATSEVKIFCVATCLCVVGCFAMRKRLAENPEYAFALIALTVGVLQIAFMAADPVNSWDEVYHMNNAFEAAHVVQYPHLFNIKDVWATLSGTLIHLGLLLRADFEMLLRLGKLGNLLLYIVIGMMAIHRTKNGKMLLSIILLAPTNLLMASSFSYDPFLTVMIALAFAIFFGEWQRRDEPLNMKNALAMMLIMAIGVQCKAIYVAMMPIFICIPKERFKDEKHRRLYYGMICVVTTLVVLSFLAPFLTNMDSKTDSRGGGNVNAGAQVMYILTNPLAYTKTLISFLLEYLAPGNANDYLTNMGYVGSSPNFALLLILLAVAAFTDWHSPSGFEGQKWYARSFGLFVLFATVCLIATSLYVSFTPVGYYTINGCQGRYLLPILFPAVYLLGCTGVRNEVNRTVYHSIMLLGAGYIAFGALLCGPIC